MKEYLKGGLSNQFFRFPFHGEKPKKSFLTDLTHLVSNVAFLGGFLLLATHITDHKILTDLVIPGAYVAAMRSLFYGAFLAAS